MRRFISPSTSSSRRVWHVGERKKKTPLEGRHAQSEMMLAFSLALISCWRLTKESAAFQVRRSDSSGNSTAPGEENVKSDEFSAPQKTCCGWEVYFWQRELKRHSVNVSHQMLETAEAKWKNSWGGKSLDYKFIEIIFQLKTWQQLQQSVFAKHKPWRSCTPSRKWVFAQHWMKKIMTQDTDGTELHYICRTNWNPPIPGILIKKKITFWFKLTVNKKKLEQLI